MPHNYLKTKRRRNSQKAQYQHADSHSMRKRKTNLMVKSSKPENICSVMRFIRQWTVSLTFNT